MLQNTFLNDNIFIIVDTSAQLWIVPDTSNLKFHLKLRHTVPLNERIDCRYFPLGASFNVSFLQISYCILKIKIK